MPNRSWVVISAEKTRETIVIVVVPPASLEFVRRLHSPADATHSHNNHGH
ncbi:MAG: hypothetical protein P8J37_11025 [Fuerstiella sp.]|nr:hypothetical protein [Fuerstiella sp.]